MRDQETRLVAALLDTFKASATAAWEAWQASDVPSCLMSLESAGVTLGQIRARFETVNTSGACPHPEEKRTYLGRGRLAFLCQGCDQLVQPEAADGEVPHA